MKIEIRWICPSDSFSTRLPNLSDDRGWAIQSASWNRKFEHDLLLGASYWQTRYLDVMGNLFRHSIDYLRDIVHLVILECIEEQGYSDESMNNCHTKNQTRKQIHAPCYAKPKRYWKIRYQYRNHQLHEFASTSYYF